ncbi:MAG: hypothetical protein QQN63_10340 [Nitrosopumilus sp.]
MYYVIVTVLALALGFGLGHKAGRRFAIIQMLDAIAETANEIQEVEDKPKFKGTSLEIVNQRRKEQGLGPMPGTGHAEGTSDDTSEKR